MPLRNAGRWTVLGFALTWLALMGGCRWLPARRPAATLDPRQVSARPVADDSPATASALPMADPTSTARARVPLPTLPLRAISDAEALAENPPAPTPYLDAALDRAGEIEAITLSEFDEPEPRPFLPPTEPDTPDLAGQSDRPDPDSSAEDGAIELTVYAPDRTTARPPTVEAEPPTVEAEPATPEMSWRTGLDALRELARDRASSGPDPTGLWLAREQVLTRLAEAADPSGIDPEQILWQTALAILADAEPPADSEPEPTEPEPASPAEPAEPDLAVVGLCVCQRVEGFGLYEPADPTKLKKGQTITLYWEVEGLQADSDGSYFRTRLASAVEILPAEGESDADKPLWSRELGTADDICRRRRRDYFVNSRLTLPDSLPPGPYRLRLTLDDLISGRSTSQTLNLAIAP